MIPKEVILCRVDQPGNSFHGFYYVASLTDGEPQCEPESTPVKAVEAFARFFHSATNGKVLDRLTLKILERVGSVSLADES